MSSPPDRLFDLTGRAAVVTGGAGLIGAQVCRGLAAHGAAVAVADIDGDAAARLAAEIDAEYPNRAVGLACDVSEPASVAEMVKQACDAFGGIHILHNNAATKGDDLEAFFAPVEDYKVEVWRRVMAVNLDGMFLVAQAVGRQMIAQGGGGSIIQTASIYGLVGPDPRLYEGSRYRGTAMSTPPVYAASKAAVIGLTKYLATHWAAAGIRVNALVPGGVEGDQNETFRDNYRKRTPLGRMARTDDLVGAVVFLASDASCYVTGQTMVVDGGWTAW